VSGPLSVSVVDYEITYNASTRVVASSRAVTRARACASLAAVVRLSYDEAL